MSKEIGIKYEFHAFKTYADPFHGVGQGYVVQVTRHVNGKSALIFSKQTDSFYKSIRWMIEALFRAADDLVTRLLEMKDGEA